MQPHRGRKHSRFTYLSRPIFYICSLIFSTNCFTLSMVKINTGEFLELLYTFTFTHKECNHNKQHHTGAPYTLEIPRYIVLEHYTDCPSQQTTGHIKNNRFDNVLKSPLQRFRKFCSEDYECNNHRVTDNVVHDTPNSQYRFLVDQFCFYPL